uniref:MFS transporter n=1 Tax=Phytoactinopolyspora endophytica TaxID=1642495 RepID=UPI00101D6E6F
SGRLDIAGASTATGALMVFVYALHHAATHGWTTGLTVVWFAAAALLMTAFVRIEACSPAPLVPASVLKNRTLLAANLTALFGFGAFFAFIFIGSLLMQQELGYSPAKTGLACLATTLTFFAAASIAGRLAAVGVRRLLVIGLSLFAVGVLSLTRVSADAGYLDGLLPAFVLTGTGFGLCVPLLQIGALSGVAATESGLASGLVETTREIGGAAGLAAVATVLLAGSGLGGFQAAFGFIGVLAVVAAVTAALGFAGSARQAGRHER